MDQGFEGAFAVDPASTVPLYRQLYTGVRAAVLSGRLPAGTRLPASRRLALDLGVSRKTVLTATEQLVAEGYLEGTQGSGMRVAEGAKWKDDQFESVLGERIEGRPDSTFVDLRPSVRKALDGGRNSEPGFPPQPLQPGLPDMRLFPSSLWARALRRAVIAQPAAERGYVAGSGYPGLKRVLAERLRDKRMVLADPDDLIVTPSAQAALDMIARLLAGPGERVWIEEPGYRGARAAFLNVGADIVPVPVDEQGMVDPASGAGPPPRLIYVTPSHQYPLGHTMTLARRQALLDFAEATGAIVIEDDYDSEFRYEGRPIAALQGLRPGARVIYVGTFAKNLAPAIRVGYFATPPQLRDAFVLHQRNTGQMASAEIQRALAEFIADGHYNRHIRRMQAIYAARRDALIESLERLAGGQATPMRPPGGMQLVAEISPDRDDGKLERQLREQGVHSRALSGFYLGTPRRRGLLLGYAGWDETQIEQAVARIAKQLAR